MTFDFDSVCLAVHFVYQTALGTDQSTFSPSVTFSASLSDGNSMGFVCSQQIASFGLSFPILRETRQLGYQLFENLPSFGVMLQRCLF